jgi:hypothetical protein
MKNIPKESNTVATKKGGRLLIDIPWNRTETFADNRYCLLIMDEYTHLLCYYFMKTIDATNQHLINLIIDLQEDKNIQVKYIRCDNLGENKDTQQEIIKLPNNKVQFEFTAPDTPQQNVKIGRSLRLFMVKTSQH